MPSFQELTWYMAHLWKLYDLSRIGMGYVLASSTSSALGWQGEGHVSTPSRRHFAMMHSKSHRTKKLSQGHQRKPLVAKPFWFFAWDLNWIPNPKMFWDFWHYDYTYICFALCWLKLGRWVSLQNLWHVSTWFGANQHSNIGINPINNA